jgi:two-component system, chemotaxis family, chemotaxis protein CheY
VLASQSSRKPILLVDDDQEIRDSMASALAREGYAVAAASDGADALHQLEGGLSPCLILLDLMMPRKDGYEFRREQLSNPRLAAIPTLAISASRQLLERAQGLGFADVVRKPLRFEKLRELVDSHRLR